MALQLYKPEEATRSRGGLAASLGAIVLYGIISLWEWLAVDFWVDDLAGGWLGDEFPISPRSILAMVLILISAFVIYILANNVKIVEFLIATEKEMEKVSWPPKNEVISSSIVVVATVIIMAVYLGLVDYGLVAFKDKIPWDSVWAKVFG